MRVMDFIDPEIQRADTGVVGRALEIRGIVEEVIGDKGE